jgi:hypothetical protein
MHIKQLTNEQSTEIYTDANDWIRYMSQAVIDFSKVIWTFTYRLIRVQILVQTFINDKCSGNIFINRILCFGFNFCINVTALHINSTQ